MSFSRTPTRGLLLLALALLGCRRDEPAVAPVKVEPDAILIKNVRLFDGAEVQPRVSVLIRGGVVDAIEPQIDEGQASTVVDGEGQTLLPGLIDAHVHVRVTQDLRTSASLGVTTVLDMLSSPSHNRRWRREDPTRSRFYSSDLALTAPGGHGTQVGYEVHPVGDAAEVPAWVSARVDEGADYIKLIFDDGYPSLGVEFARLSEESLRAGVKSAHEAEKLAVVHIGSASEAATALEAGADGLAHTYLLGDLDGAELTRVAESSRAFVVPTLGVLMGLCDPESARSFAGLERVRAMATPSELGSLVGGFPLRADAQRPGCEAALESVGLFNKAGMSVLAGSDAGNPGTAHGVSLHRELQLLVQAGLTPVEALSAATSASADAFGLSELGRVQVGLPADLLLVDGDPTVDIADTLRVQQVWIAGEPVEGSERAERVTQSWELPAPKEPAGLISDFNEDDPSAAFGFRWLASNDKAFGGSSSSAITLESAEPARGGSCLRVTGSVASRAFAFAGAMLQFGEGMGAAVDLSGYAGVRFRMRGAVGSYSVQLFAQTLGALGAVQGVELGEGWTDVELRFADLGHDGFSAQGLFIGSRQPGEVDFCIDDVELLAK